MTVTRWIHDTSRAFRLSHLTQGSSTDFNTSQNCIVGKQKRNRCTNRGAKEESLHRPEIESGSVPWQGTILPLDHRCLCSECSL